MLIFVPGILQKGKNLGLFWTKDFSTHLSATYCISPTDLPNALADAPKSENHLISLKVIAPRFSLSLKAHYFGTNNSEDNLRTRFSMDCTHKKSVKAFTHQNFKREQRN